MNYADFVVAFLFFYVSCIFIVLTLFESPILSYLFLLFSVLCISQWKSNYSKEKKYFRCQMKEGEILSEYLNPIKKLTKPPIGEAIGVVIDVKGLELS